MVSIIKKIVFFALITSTLFAQPFKIIPSTAGYIQQYPTLVSDDTIKFNGGVAFNNYMTANIQWSNDDKYQDYYIIIENAIDYSPFVFTNSYGYLPVNSNITMTLAISPTEDTTYNVPIRFYSVDFNYNQIDTFNLILHAVINGFDTSSDLIVETPINFGTINSNTVKNVGISNNGTSNLTILDYANTNETNFNISNKKYNLNPGEINNFSVTCNPTTNGILIDTITIVHTGNNSPTSIVLNATITGYGELDEDEILFQIASDQDNSTMKYVGFVNLVSETPGLKIYYTTDGSTPTTSSNPYYMPIELTATTTLKAIGYRINNSATDVFSHTYTFTATKQSSFSISTHTYIEAEATTNFNNFHPRPQYQNVSNGIFMKMPGESVYNDPHLRIAVVPTTTGSYYVWARMSSDNQMGCKVGVSVNGITVNQQSGEISGDPILNNDDNWMWRWVLIDAARTMNSGSTYTYDFYDRWEPVHIDKLLFTTNSSFEPPNFDIISPNGHERYLANQSANIEWVKVGNCSNVKLEYSIDNGTNWTTISNSTTNDGSYTWTVGSTLTNNGLVRITGLDSDSGVPTERSDYGFSITDSANYNPYSNSVTFASPVQAYTDRVGNYYINQRPDRATYLSQINSKSLETPWYYGFKDGNLLDYNGTVDAEAATTFRAHNTVSTLHALGNIRSIYSLEGWIGNTNSFPSNWWMRSTTTTDPIYAKGEGRRTAYFHATGYDDWVVDRHIAHLTAGFNGIQYDSFDFEVGSGQNSTYDGKWRTSSSGTIFALLDYSTGTYYKDSDYLKHLQQLLYEVNRKVEVYAGTKFPINYYNTANRPSTYWELRHNMFFEFYALESYLGMSLIPEAYNHVSQTHFDFCESGKIEWEANYISTLFNNNVGVIFENYNYVTSAYTCDDCGTPRVPYFKQTASSSIYYELSMALMGFYPETKFSLSLQNSVGESWNGYANLQKARFVPKGKFRRIAAGVLKREFTDAIVYINGGTSSSTQSLGGSYYYLLDNGNWSGSTVSSFTIAPGEGRIFVSNTNFTGGSLPDTVEVTPPDTSGSACEPPAGDLYIAGRGCFESEVGTWNNPTGNWTFTQSNSWSASGTYSLKATNNGSGGTFTQWLSSVGDLTGYLTPGQSYTIKFTAKTNTGTCSYMIRGGTTSTTLSTETNVTTTPTEHTITYTCENSAYDYFYWGYSRSGATEVFIDDISIVEN